MNTIMIKCISQHLEEQQLSGQRSIDASLFQYLLVLIKTEEDIGMQIRKRKALCQVLFIEMRRRSPVRWEGWLV